jgi:ribosomal protein S3AE
MKKEKGNNQEMNRILRVNMTDLTTKFEDVPEKYKVRVL